MRHAEGDVPGSNALAAVTLTAPIRKAHDRWNHVCFDAPFRRGI